jgi:hypothetical protein
MEPCGRRRTGQKVSTHVTGPLQDTSVHPWNGRVIPHLSHAKPVTWVPHNCTVRPSFRCLQVPGNYVWYPVVTTKCELSLMSVGWV